MSQREPGLLWLIADEERANIHAEALERPVRIARRKARREVHALERAAARAARERARAEGEAAAALLRLKVARDQAATQRAQDVARAATARLAELAPRQLETRGRQ